MEEVALPFDPEHGALIDRHLAFYRALHMGERVVTTPAQRRFVAVMAGLERAETRHEHAYAAYLEATGDTLPPETLYRFRRIEAGEIEATSVEDIALLRTLRRGFPPVDAAHAEYVARRRAEREKDRPVGEIALYSDGAHPVPVAVAHK